ncbi:aminotransferase class V-fold PLP-dependent enzyme [Streptomyces sp. NPDC005388]|uniref:aminotransferase class V-fold PLP-dependent enzyme n=1 Tax=Streptomyces sp. NPDC005388 TaxID=3156717 RepID=UPI0033A20C2A
MNATPSSTDHRDHTYGTDRTAPADREGRTVHLDTAGWGTMPAAVRALVADCASREDRYGPHELEEDLEDVLRTEVHERLGALLGVPAADTAVVTDAAGAFDALVSRLAPGRGERVWTTPYESAARLTALYALRDRTRCTVEVVPLREDGDLDLEWMARHIDDDVALVSVVHVPSGCGIVNPVEEIGQILAPHRCVYAVDASYSAGQLPVDAGRIGCQLLTGDGWRFLRGPYAVGFAFLAPRLRAAFEDAAAHRPLPPNAAVAGLNAALAHHTATTDGPAGLAGQGLLPALRAAVEECPGTELIAPGRVQSAILAFRHRDLPAALVRRRLAARGVVLWKTVAQETPLHLPRSGATTALRASLGPDTTPQDIARFGRALREVVREETAGAQRPRPARTLPPAPTPDLTSAPVPPAGPRPRPSARRHLTLCPTP